MTERSLWSDPSLASSNPALRYDQMLVPVMFAPLAQEMLRRARPPPSTRVLDMACGTGVVAATVKDMIGQDGEVVGIDISDPMLAVARHKQSDVAWRQGDMAEPVGERFDVIYCQQGLQFVPDLDKALANLVEALADGGRLTVSVWRGPLRNPLWSGIADALESHVSPEVGDSMRNPFVFDDVSSLVFLAREHGLRVEAETYAFNVVFPSASAFVDAALTATPIAAEIADIDDATMATLRSDAAARVGDYEGPNGLVAPMETWFVTGQK